MIAVTTARFGGLFSFNPMTKKKFQLTEVSGIRETWEYRGVRITTSARGGYMTYSQIVSAEPPHGTMRFHGTTTIALLRMIDKHLIAGGRIKAL